MTAEDFHLLYSAVRSYDRLQLHCSCKIEGCRQSRNLGDYAECYQPRTLLKHFRDLRAARLCSRTRLSMAQWSTFKGRGIYLVSDLSAIQHQIDHPAIVQELFVFSNHQNIRLAKLRDDRSSASLRSSKEHYVAKFNFLSGMQMPDFETVTVDIFVRQNIAQYLDEV